MLSRNGIHRRFLSFPAAMRRLAKLLPLIRL
jgi:hypothetical protein